MRAYLNSGGSITITMYGKTLTLDSNSMKIKGSDEEHAFNILVNVAGGLNADNYATFLERLKDPNAAKEVYDEKNGDGHICLGTMTIDFKNWGRQKRGGEPSVTGVTDSAEGLLGYIEGRMISHQYRHDWAELFRERGLNVPDDQLDATINGIVSAILQDPSKYDVEAAAVESQAGHETMHTICEEFFTIATDDFKNSHPLPVQEGARIEGQWADNSKSGTTDAGTTFATTMFDLSFTVPGDNRTHTLSVGRASIGDRQTSYYSVFIDGKEVGRTDQQTLLMWGFKLDEAGKLAVKEGDLDAQSGENAWTAIIWKSKGLLPATYGVFGLQAPGGDEVPANLRQMLAGVLTQYFAAQASAGAEQPGA
ncbi:Uncharacterised protein [Candidatus Burarchaeum australiense]|nr:Uncharacterised protein [Candidatus Burarchaeum australiense]